jgi:hypothetical protein
VRYASDPTPAFYWKRTRRRAAIQPPPPVICDYVPQKPKLDNQKPFRGAVLDTGAPASVIGLKEYHLYCEAMAIKMEIRPDLERRSFRFGEKQINLWVDQNRYTQRQDSFSIRCTRFAP